jgi:BirA family biotin operon repressor/biotin-[acetyl-CoA-carboxylase] ligase
MKPVTQRSAPEIISKISQQLYPGNDIFLGSSEKTTSFKHFFISEHVPFSQYDMLLQIAKLSPAFRENILCFAGSGNNFHGFRQRRWTSVTGNIHLSVLLNPGQFIEHAEIAFLILAADAVTQTINQLTRIRQKAMIRWVNDITIYNCKVGGVLAHTQILGNIIDKVVLGIGLNVDQSPEIDNDQFVNTATHINDHIDGSAYPLNHVFEILLSRLEQNYIAIMNNNYQNLINYYINHSQVIGKRVEVYSDPREGKSTKVAEGIVSGITENLELILSGQKELIRKGRLKLLNSA